MGVPGGAPLIFASSLPSRLGCRRWSISMMASQARLVEETSGSGGGPGAARAADRVSAECSPLASIATQVPRAILRRFAEVLCVSAGLAACFGNIGWRLALNAV